MTAFCFIVAAPRSGTNMLRDAVCRSFRITNVGEAFVDFGDPQCDFRQASHILRRANFFNVRLDILRKHPELAIPSPANQSLILEAFLRHLEISEGAERYFVDVKYASWHHLDTYFRLPHQPPFLLTELKRRGFPLVHLKRRNIFAQYCSLKLAIQTRVWQVLADRPGDTLRLSLDPARLVEDLDDLRDAQRIFDRWLAEYPIHLLEYESLLDGTGFSKQVEGTFTNVFGMAPVEPLFTQHRKATPPLRDVVINKDEAFSALKGTVYQSMAEEALA